MSLLYFFYSAMKERQPRITKAITAIITNIDSYIFSEGEHYESVPHFSYIQQPELH